MGLSIGILPMRTSDHYAPWVLVEVKDRSLCGLRARPLVSAWAEKHDYPTTILANIANPVPNLIMCSQTTVSPSGAFTVSMAR